MLLQQASRPCSVRSRRQEQVAILPWPSSRLLRGSVPVHSVSVRNSNADDVQQAVQDLQSQQQDQKAPMLQLGTQGSLQPGQVLNAKYRIQEVLGAGSNAVTYKALTLETGQEVAVKALSLRNMRDWKQLDLFQREASTLAELSHPAIPRYLDYFEEDTNGDKTFYLVQEVVAGKTLAQMVSSGMRASEEEVKRVAGSLLDVLAYLSGLRPPVIHRDVKPENIVLQGGVWGGKVYLVDFGGVQAVASITSLDAPLGSTVVGTYGYMAPEQFRGAAQPASDLYAAGATLLYLISGQPPSAFPQERMRIAWREGLGRGTVSPVLEALLDGLLEPLAEDRLTAAEAKAVLAGTSLEELEDKRRAAAGSGSSTGSRSGFNRRRAQQQAPLPPQSAREAYQLMAANIARGQTGLSAPVTKPKGSRVVLERSVTRLDIDIPPKGLSGDTIFTGSFALVWNGFVAAWTLGAVASGGILFALFSVPFWFAGAQLARSAIGSALMRERFAIGMQRWRLGQQLAVFGNDGKADFSSGQNQKTQEGSSADLSGARVVTTAIVNDVPQTCIEVIEGVNKYRFGEGLEMTEQLWLVQEINDFIASLKGRDIDFNALPAPDMPSIVREQEETNN